MNQESAGRGSAPLRARVLLLIAASLFTFLAAEGGLRLLGISPYPDWSPRGLHVADPDLGLRPSPNADVVQEGDEFRVRIRTDEIGLRSPASPADPSHTVLVIGDSFAFGHGVEDDEVMTAVLSRELSEGGYPGAWTANAAVSSYGTGQAVARFRRLTTGPSAALKPDVCVLVFFEGNDPFDDIRESLTVDQGYVVHRGERVSFSRRLKLWIKKRSAVYRLLGDAMERVRGDSERAPVIEGDHPAFGFDLFRRALPESAARAMNTTERTLADFADACTDVGSVGLVVIQPTRFRANPSWWSRHRERFQFEEGAFDLPKVSRSVRGRCAELGLESLDLIDAVHAESGGSSYFDASLGEVHMNRAGHARAGRAMADAVIPLLPDCK